MGGNVRKRTLANLSKLPMDAVDAIRRILKGEKLVSVEVAFKIVENGSRHHGHVDAVLSAMRQLGFEKLVGSRHSPERDLVVAMVVARILEPQSKLATSQWWHTTTLPEILGVSDAREDDLYAAMDWVLKRQEVIEKKLAARHLQNDGLALYDLTSSYFEGVSCPIARLGYDRDGKKGKPQINYGLLTNERGIPVSVSVFEGNTGDPKTLLPQVEKVQERFGIEQFVMVGDRGMITQTQIDELREMDGVDWITALRPEPIRKLINARVKAEAAQVKAEARMTYHAVRRREVLLRQSLDEQKVQARKLRRVAGDYGQMQSELDSQRDMLQSLLRKQSEANLSAELGERQPVNMRIVDLAEVAESPYSPSVFLNLFVGGLLGIALGIGLAFVLDSIDRSIFTPEDLRRHSHLPYLGMIPRLTASESGRALLLPAGPLEPQRAIRANGARSARSQLAYRESSRAETTSWNVIGERFRFLRGSLLLSTPGLVPKVVLVSGPDQDCGKTFVSCNLGGAFVQLGKRVLLVDADLRSPNLHRVFKYQNRVGLTNVLTRQKPLADGCVKRTAVPDLFLLMAGPRSPNPGELLGSDAMAETLKECARHFDVVIVDSAPLLPVFDTHTLRRLSDATILVVRSGMTTRQALRTSTELIERAQGKVTGVVLNDVDLADYAQSYYHSSYTYESSHYTYPEAETIG